MECIKEVALLLGIVVLITNSSPMNIPREASAYNFTSNVNQPTGFWLPAIQRKFVWNEDKICKLFDSMMRGYPIGTCLLWGTNKTIRKRKFITDFTKGIDPRTLFVPGTNEEKMMVLDGQQRIQSLLIGLRGTYENKFLCFDILSTPGSGASVEELVYKFTFERSIESKPQLTKVAELIASADDAYSIGRALIKKYNDATKKKLSEAEADVVMKNAATLRKVFREDNALSFMVVDSVVNPLKYTDNDVVEIFVRANNGGTKLEKSELLFALLTANWDAAEASITKLQAALKESGFEFKRDFILKACLIISGKKAAYDVDKFRDAETVAILQRDWDRIQSAFTEVVDFIRDFTPISNSKVLTYKNAVLPLINYAFHNAQLWRNPDNKKIAADYLKVVSLSGVFSGSKDTLLDDLSLITSANANLTLRRFYDAIEKNNRETHIKEDKLWKIKYRKPNSLFVMQTLRPEVKFNPANPGNAPSVDHLHPQKGLKERDVPLDDIHQIANLTLLTAAENSKLKRGLPLAEFLANYEAEFSKNAKEEFISKNLIPTDPELWKIENYAAFIEARKKLILENPSIAKLISAPTENLADDTEEDDQDEASDSNE